MSFYIVLTADADSFDGKLHLNFERPYNLQGKWEMAVISFSYDRNEKVFLFCNLVEYSYVNNTKMQFLDYLNTKNIKNPHPRYVKVNRKRFANINVEVRQNIDNSSMSSNSNVVCVLHFRKS